MILTELGIWLRPGARLLEGNGYALTLVVPPASEPMTTAQAKKHLRVDGADEDEEIASLISAARVEAERVTGRQLLTATLAFSMDRFPPEIRLPRPPLQSVESITYIDNAGVQQTMASGDYHVDFDTKPARITPTYGKCWPWPRWQTGAVVVTFVAGETAISDIDPMIIHAMRLMIGGWYANRETVVVGSTATVLPMGADSILMARRIPMIF